MPYKKVGKNKYRSPSGKVYSKKQIQAIEIEKHKDEPGATKPRSKPKVRRA